MADFPLRSLIRDLRRVIESQGGVRAPSDAKLVEAFLQHRDEGAVEMLVWRHGTMVLNLCRRILHDEHRAEDAFQAAFLVFVRKAASIGKRQCVGSWLYKVAYRVAHKLRAELAKQPEQTMEVCDLDDFPRREPADDLIWRQDLRPVLDDEINRLPEKFRSPIILCYLQGHTTEEAAELLGCPRGTILSRLSAAREQLRSRISRRGLAVPALWLSTHLAANTSAAAPLALTDATVKAAVKFAAGTANEFASRSVTTLTEGVLQAMLITKLKTVAVVLFAVVILSMGAGLMAQWGLAASHTNRKKDVDMALVFAKHSSVPPQKDPKILPKGPAVPRQEKPANPLPADVVAAWEKAGALSGWMTPHYFVIGFGTRGGEIRSGGEKGKEGEVPGFQFKMWQPAVLGFLPQPGRGFGLSLVGTQVTDAGLKELAGLKHLERLHLGGTQVTDAGLKELARLNTLQWLDLAHTQVTDAGLKELARLKSLQTLNLSVTRVTDAGLKELAGLTTLQTLNLSSTQVTDAGLKELVGLTSLHELGLGANQITDVGLKKLAGLKSLQKLVLTLTQVTDAGLKELAGLKSLQTLFLGGTQVTDAGLKELAGLKSLQRLELFETQVTDVGLKELAGLKSLQELCLGLTQVTDAGLGELAGLKSLQVLELGATRVTDVGMKELAGLKSLQVLGLVATQVTDVGLKELAGLKSLQNLTLARTQVTDIGLKELAGLKSLQRLELSGTQVTDAGLKELAGLKHLERLWLGGTKVMDAGLKELAGLKSLQWLNLSDTQVTDASLKELAGLKSLTLVNLRNTKVTDAGLKELVRLKALEHLDLAGTEVTDVGVMELRKALPGINIRN